MESTIDLASCLADIPDRRRAEGKMYGQVGVILFSIIAMLSGARSYRQIHALLDRRLAILNAAFPQAALRRAPAYTSVRGILQRLDPAELEQAFRRHADGLDRSCAAAPSRFIAIDGKTLRQSFDAFADRKAAHVLSAFAVDHQIILAHEIVDEKSNEIPAVQTLIATLGLKPFFLWLNPTRMHIVTHLSPKYKAMRNSKNGWTIHEAGMVQLDDDVGLVMKKLKDMGVDDNTIVVFTTDNGTEVFTWPDGGQTPFAQSKGTVMEGGFRAPAMIRWPGKVPAGKVENGIISGLDWFPTFLAAAGNPNVVEELKKGKQLGDRTYKVHLDGYNQMDLITGKGPSNRNEIWYFGESELGAVRIGDYKYRFIDQPGGWLGDKTKPDVPYLTDLRLDPFERTGWPDNGTKAGSQEYFQWFKYEFWRFVFVQQQVEKLAMTAVEFPPMQKGASFNLDAVKAKVEAARAAMAK